jgi:uncharacterized membrane protein YgcG
MKRLGLLFLMAGMTLAAVPAHGAVDLNAFQRTGHVNDYAGVLSPRESSGMERLLGELESLYTVDLSLITLPEMDGREIAEAAKDVYDQWDLGRPTNNQSALLLLDARGGQMHLYVGMGLRGVLNRQWIDVMSEKIGAQIENRRYAKACVNAMMAMVQQVYNKSEDLPRMNSRLVKGVGALETMAENRRALPIAGLIAAGFGALLIVGTVMGAGKQTSAYEWGRDFERNRTGPFGNKKPRWL